MNSSHSLSVAFCPEPSKQTAVTSCGRPLCWGLPASRPITCTELCGVTKAWVNFNSASDESSSKRQNIGNRPWSWRRPGSAWNLFGLVVSGEFRAVCFLWMVYQPPLVWRDELTGQHAPLEDDTDSSLIPQIPRERYHGDALRKMTSYKIDGQG